jgi:hypothetical protein
MNHEPTSLEIVGTIKQISEPITTASGFTKREFVVTTDERYPQPIALELVKDKCATLDKFREGERVRVSFNLRGREYNGRHYVNLQAWRIASCETEAAAPAPKQAEANAPPADTDENYPF